MSSGGFPISITEVYDLREIDRNKYNNIIDLLFIRRINGIDRKPCDLIEREYIILKILHRIVNAEHRVYRLPRDRKSGPGIVRYLLSINRNETKM